MNQPDQITMAIPMRTARTPVTNRFGTIVMAGSPASTSIAAECGHDSIANPVGWTEPWNISPTPVLDPGKTGEHAEHGRDDAGGAGRPHLPLISGSVPARNGGH
jgi:hypothetical protein